MEEVSTSLPLFCPRSPATCLCVLYVPFNLSWKHISDLPLADPSFGEPGRIDILLGVDIFVDILLSGRRTGPPGTPMALETEFGWVLCGGTERSIPPDQISVHSTAFHTTAVHLSGDDILRQFWKIEEPPLSTPSLLWRSVLSCSILKPLTIAIQKEDSLFLYQRNQTQE